MIVFITINQTLPKFFKDNFCVGAWLLSKLVSKSSRLKNDPPITTAPGFYP